MLKEATLIIFINLWVLLGAIFVIRKWPVYNKIILSGLVIFVAISIGLGFFASYLKDNYSYLGNAAKKMGYKHVILSGEIIEINGGVSIFTILGDTEVGQIFMPTGEYGSYSMKLIEISGYIIEDCIKKDKDCDNYRFTAIDYIKIRDN